MNRKLVSKSNRVLRDVLNKEENMDVFQDMLESILKIHIKEIKLRPYLKNFEFNLQPEEDFGVADVEVILEDTNEKINVGFQFIDGIFVQSKMLMYYGQIHLKQKEHNNSDDLNKTITINIIDFSFINSPEYHNVLTLGQKSNDKINLDINKSLNEIEMHTIELSKFRQNQSKIETKEDAWISYLDGSNQKFVEFDIENFEKINKLNRLLDEYWENEVME